MVKIMKPQHSEGPVAEAIEEQTAKLPSDVFLWAGLGALGASFAMNMFGKKDAGNFVGQLAPVLLICGLYNKIVKIHGHD